jgi:1-acyl-sn-glycerol-3-phosphate acyltransferase
VKESALRGPWGALARHFGAAGIDRSRTGNVVQAYIDEFLKRDKMVLTITPEGTRKKVADWRRGFYHVAIGAGVPIVPVAFDFSRKRILIGQAFLPSSDVERDVPLLKSFFRREMARHPDQF